MAAYKIRIESKKKIYEISKELFYQKGYEETKITDILLQRM